MDRDAIPADQKAAELWHSWGTDAFAVIQRQMDDARDRMQLDATRYWLDVETQVYALASSGLRAA